MSENTITNARYSRNLFTPSTIFSAPKLVIFVAGPVTMKADALPMLIPEASHCRSRNISASKSATFFLVEDSSVRSFFQQYYTAKPLCLSSMNGYSL